MGNKQFSNVSVVVPTLNSEKTIGKCLDSLMLQDYDKSFLELLVIDNGSTDRTLEIVSKYPVKIVSEFRKGRGSAYNRGFKESSNDYVAFVDSDAVVPETWLSVASRTIQSDSSLATVYFKSIAPYDSNYFQKCVDALLSKGWGGANGAIYRKSALTEIGGFDASLVYLQEDDVRIKLVERGYKFKIVNSPLIWHSPRTSLSSFLNQCYETGQGLMRLSMLHKKPLSLVKLVLSSILALFPIFLTLLFLINIELAIFFLGILILFSVSYVIFLWQKTNQNYRKIQFLLPAIFLLWISKVGNLLGFIGYGISKL